MSSATPTPVPRHHDEVTQPNAVMPTSADDARRGMSRSPAQWEAEALAMLTDGIDLRVSGRCQVLIRGRRVPIVGAVSMDMMMVEVSGLDDVSPGDEVVIIGRQGNASWQQIDAREMAAAIGTIPWEIVCRIGARIERQYR